MTRKETGDDVADGLSICPCRQIRSCPNVVNKEHHYLPHLFVRRILLHSSLHLWSTRLVRANNQRPFHTNRRPKQRLGGNQAWLLRHSPIDYEVSMKIVFSPDVDDIMSSMPNKKYLALVADKSRDRCGPIPVHKIDIFLVGRSMPTNAMRGLTGGECVPISSSGTP